MSAPRRISFPIARACRSRIPKRAAWLLLPIALLAAPAFAQDTPTLKVNEDCSSFAYAPDGRIAYAVRHVFSTRRLEIQRDDIWVVAPDGKKKKIVNGEKLVRGAEAFSYAVTGLRWSPDGTRLTAQLITSQMIDQRGNTQEGTMVLLLDESGKEIKISGADSVIPGGLDGAWLGDGVTVAYLEEKVKPKLLYSIGSVRPVAGRGATLFADRAFAAVAWYPKQNSAVAVERDAMLSGAPRLVFLDLLKETARELATLDGFVGGLTISPSGAKVAYYHDADVLEIRDLASPDRIARVRIGYGTYAWTPDERRLLLKRGLERRSNDLVWIDLPPLQPQPASPSASAIPVAEPSPRPILHDLTFRDFEISPDGRSVAVTEPGKRNLLVYPLS